ncbi:MAG: hypothetical protein M1549_00325 [Candidatus Dependentiae bacterium]|nr:hypothetical protein [Candidatus Dependentiae bacterium]
MISLQNTDAIIAVSLSFFAFALSITASGTLQAYIARLMGDETATNLGYADFNPFTHLGLFDLIYFVLINVMLGNLVPIDITEIRQNRRPLRLFLLFGSRTMVHLLLAIITGLLMIAITTSWAAMGTTADPVQLVANLRMGLPPYLYIVSLLCASMTFANIFLASFALVRDTVYGVLLCKFEKDPSFAVYINPILIFGFLLLWILFSRQILALLGAIVSFAITLCGSACGF